MSAITESIYRAVIEHCRPAPQLPWLRHVPAAKGALCVASDPDELLASMLRQFTSEDLRAAGVLASVSGAETADRLHDGLAADDRRLIAIRNEKNRPVDLLTERGSLLQRGPAVLSMAEDWHFQQCLRQTEAIFLAFSMDDVIALRSVGLAVAPATGLDRLRGHFLDPFLRLTGNGAEVGIEPRGPYATMIVLVGWSLAQRSCAVPAGFEATVGHLQNLHSDLGLSPYSWRLWRPSRDEFDRVNFVLRNGDAKRIAARFIELAEVGSKPLVEPPTVTLNDAYQALRQVAGNRRYYAGQMAETRERLESLIQQHFVGPLIDNAAADTDPLQGTLKFAIAQSIEELHRRLIDRRLNRSNDSQLAGQSRDHDDMSIQSLADYILKLSKELESCTSGATSKIHRLQLPRIRF